MTTVQLSEPVRGSCDTHTSASELAAAERATPRSRSTRSCTATSSSAERIHSPTPSSRHHAETRHSRCSAQARESGLSGVDRAKAQHEEEAHPAVNLAASRVEAEERQHMKGVAASLLDVQGRLASTQRESHRDPGAAAWPGDYGLGALPRVGMHAARRRASRCSAPW